jgi:Ca2+-binding RTX toxin-like protein
MTRIIPNNYSGQYDLDTSSESWILEDGAKISSGSGHGINEASFRSNNAITVNGSVTALSSGSAGVAIQGANSSVVIGKNGTIDAWHGVELFGDAQSVVNNGTINAYGKGIYSTDADNALTNNGKILVHSGAMDAVDGMVADGLNKVVNSKTGLIDVTGDALVVESVGGEKTLVTNLGTARGDHGSFYGWAGDEKLVNRGTLDGDVLMNSGNDTFDGTGGTVKGVVMGGQNDDLYIIDKASFHLAEKASEGTDTVRSSASWTLGGNFEHLQLTGTAAINGKGNGLANDITGNIKANTLSGMGGADDLDGGKGNDMLTGGAGADTFHFAKGSGKDTITDFAHGVDTIDLSHLSAVTDFTDLIKHHLSVHGHDLMITAGADHLIIEDTRKAELHASDFGF